MKNKADLIQTVALHKFILVSFSALTDFKQCPFGAKVVELASGIAQLCSSVLSTGGGQASLPLQKCQLEPRSYPTIYWDQECSPILRTIVIVSKSF